MLGGFHPELWPKVKKKYSDHSVLQINNPTTVTDICIYWFMGHMNKT